MKDQRERVAQMRRELPMGRLVATDYVFREGPADIRDAAPANFRDVRLSELFAPNKNRLIVDHMMWAAHDKLPGPMCNMWADGYNAVAQHVGDKVDFVLWPRSRSPSLGTGAAAVGTKFACSPATTTPSTTTSSSKKSKANKSPE